MPLALCDIANLVKMHGELVNNISERTREVCKEHEKLSQEQAIAQSHHPVGRTNRVAIQILKNSAAPAA